MRFPAFDARAWNLPKEEVVNAFIWRQQDATRNAIQLLGQHHYSHKQLEGVNCNQIQEMVFKDHGINFNNLPTPQKRGVCIVKKSEQVRTQCPDKREGCAVLHTVRRSRWVVDENIPIFTQDRDYIQRLVDVAPFEEACDDTSGSATPTQSPTT